MRWLMAACLVSLACAPQDPVESEPSALVSEAPLDPCLWDGKGVSFCFADVAAVFDGKECRTVCMTSVPAPRPGVFRTAWECAQTCMP